MFALVHKTIETTLKTGVLASAEPTLPIRWPNVPWKQPTAGEWIALKIVPGDGMQASLGQTKLSRQLGLVMVQVFTPKNSGTRRALDLADLIGSIFRHQTKTSSDVSVIFREPQMGDVGERMDNFQTNVQIPFQGERIY